ncbi:MAG: hypothetical protein AAFR73_02980 [Pseudomonadota bacterium]
MSQPDNRRRPRPAIEIADDLLERTGEAMQAGDFGSFRQHFAMPYVLETFDGMRLLQTRDELRTVFEAVHAFRVANGIVGAMRENVSAEYIDDTTIGATHVSQLMKRDDALFGRSYPSYSIIKYDGEAWRIQYCQYALQDLDQLNTALTVPQRKTPRNCAALSELSGRGLRIPGLRTSS